METEISTPETSEKIQPYQRVRSDWKAIVDKVSYKGIVNNIPYIAFVALLCVLYISTNQETIQTQRELNRQKEVLKELRWKYMDIKSQLMTAGMESQIIRNATALGLKPLMLPAYKIITDTTWVKR